MNNEFKALELIYQDTAIHFLINPGNINVMVNATEMAKVFSKSVKHFLRSGHAKAFISVLERAPFGDSSKPLAKDEIMDNRGHMGMYFCRPLALKFAAWLDPEFEHWVFTRLDELIYGNYKRHWEAHAMQEMAKAEMERIKQAIITDATTEDVIAYFEAERKVKDAGRQKTKAINRQIKLMFPKVKKN